MRVFKTKPFARFANREGSPKRSSAKPYDAPNVG